MEISIESSQPSAFPSIIGPPFQYEWTFESSAVALP